MNNGPAQLVAERWIAMEDDLSVSEQENIASLLEQLDALGAPFAKAEQQAKQASTQQQASARGANWQAELRYRALIEQLPVVTFVAGLDERLQDLYISPQIEALLGFTQDQWLENPILWFQQLHPDDREAWVAEFARTCATGANFRSEYRMIARDGRVVWIQGECQLIRDELDGRPLYLQGIAFDITHRKRSAEDEKAKIAAETASAAKSEFLARMSHEIRTPLNGVVGMIDLLRNTKLDENQERYARLAREAADSLLGVINDILDFSKIEAGKVEIETIEFDFYKVIEDLTELLAPVAAKKNLALAAMLKPDVPLRLVGDPNRIRQVVTNLVGNALKFTQKGSVTVRAALDRVDDDNHVIVRIKVQDTGIGIPPDRLNRLFQSFSQVDSSTTRKFGGTGLGLAISKRLVELMGGEVGVDSKIGEGTTFWFTLKLGQIAEPAAQPQSPAEVLRGVRILAVESDPNWQHVIAEQLEGRFSAKSAVVSLQDAMATLRLAADNNAPFDIILVPVATPEGGALSMGVQADPKLSGTKLIAILDIDDRTDLSAIKVFGFSARLHRPIMQSKLVDVVTSLIVRRGDADSAEASDKLSLESLKGLHLLVAEDNEMNQFVTQETLSRAGCTCELVADGSLAVQAVQRNKYDLVLMDCQMPGMDGLEAARKIREREAQSPEKGRIPIVALTADAIQGDRERCIAAGMDDYVTKPIDAAQLFAAIARMKNLSATSAPPSRADAPAAMQSEEPPIDAAALVARCMNDVTFAAQTLEKFHQRAAEDVEMIARVAVEGDLAQVSQMAHNLKAAAAHAVATPLRKVAHEIELAAARNDLEFVTAQLEKLRDEAERCAVYVPQAMDRVRQTPASPAESKGE